jgi:hypothetical protein
MVLKFSYSGLLSTMNQQKRTGVESPEDAASQIRAGHFRLSAELQKETGGSSFCTQAELPKSALIARLLELGELKAKAVDCFCV